MLQLSKILQGRKALDLAFLPEFTSKITFKGDDHVYTFQLETPISMLGSTKYDDLQTQTRGAIPKVTNCDLVNVIGKDLDEFSDEFTFTGSEADGDLVLTGYKGSKLLLDVSQPKFNNLNGELKEEPKLWLRPKKFSEVTRITLSKLPSMEDKFKTLP